MAEKWEEQIKGLKVEAAPQALLDRITTVVPHMAQRHDAPQANVFVRFMTEIRYGFALKVAAFGCIAALGILSGQQQAVQHDLIGSLLFGDIGWESVI